MIRPAAAGDLSRIFEIRDGVGANRLSDPSVVTDAETMRFVAAGHLWVWQEPGEVVSGFCGADMRDGSIWVLLVAPGHDGKGIGRALLQTACDALRDAGYKMATLRIAPGSLAERHYRAAGWIDGSRTAKGELIFQNAL